jgi:CxxC motif-containing protein
MKLHVKYRLHILVYCMNILSYIYLPSAIKLGDYIIKNLDKYIVVKGA